MQPISSLVDIISYCYHRFILFLYLILHPQHPLPTSSQATTEATSATKLPDSLDGNISSTNAENSAVNETPEVKTTENDVTPSSPSPAPPELPKSDPPPMSVQDQQGTPQASESEEPASPPQVENNKASNEKSIQASEEIQPMVTTSPAPPELPQEAAKSEPTSIPPAVEGETKPSNTEGNLSQAIEPTEQNPSPVSEVLPITDIPITAEKLVEQEPLPARSQPLELPKSDSPPTPAVQEQKEEPKTPDGQAVVSPSQTESEKAEVQPQDTQEATVTPATPSSTPSETPKEPPQDEPKATQPADKEKSDQTQNVSQITQQNLPSVNEIPPTPELPINLDKMVEVVTSEAIKIATEEIQEQVKKEEAAIVATPPSVNEKKPVPKQENQINIEASSQPSLTESTNEKGNNSNEQPTNPSTPTAKVSNETVIEKEVTPTQETSSTDQ